MARIITKELALKIAEKLRAQPDPKPKKGRPHVDYFVCFQGQIVARFGIRRGSEKDKGHDHIPRLIHLRPNEAKLFAQCTHSYDYWVERLREQGVIPPEPKQGDQSSK